MGCYSITHRVKYAEIQIKEIDIVIACMGTDKIPNSTKQFDPRKKKVVLVCKGNFTPRTVHVPVLNVTGYNGDKWETVYEQVLIDCV